MNLSKSKVSRGFWDTLKAPIIGLSPMDGVTDASFRAMVCRHSRPSVVMTEFTNVEGLARGAVKMLHAFHYDEIERPVVAQIYGVEPEAFYSTTVMLCSLGFDGIDINMGCPANKVAKLGSGAGLIRTPKLAQKLIAITKQACRDFAEGITLEKAGVHPDIIEACVRMRPQPLKSIERRELPVSIKTRIGYDTVVAEEWTKTLLEMKPVVISMHGRTLKQLYTGRADWEMLAKAAALTQDSPTTFLGNGDVDSLEDAHKKIEMYGVDGVLVGRATFGNPWFFKGHSPTPVERLQAAVEHADYLETHYPDQTFFTIRKHLAWYCHAFPGAAALRLQLMKATCAADVRRAALQFYAA